LAVTLLLILMNGLFFYILRNAVRRLGRFSRLNLIHQANIYDEFMENKEAELARLLNKTEEARGRKAAPSAGASLKTRETASGVSGILALLGARGGTAEFADAYKLLRGSVISNKDAGVGAALEQIGNAAKEEGRADRNPASEILSMFDLDARYGLCCLDASEAFRILEELLTDGAHRRLLDEYRSEKGLDAIGFFDGLRVNAFLRAPEIVVRSGDAGDSFLCATKGGRAVVTEYDESVCEGIYAISDGRLYDYSVKNGDING
jgi:hypothetical protein